MNGYSCEGISDMLSEYINRRLLPADNIKVAAHLSECEKCRKEIAFLIKLQKLAQEEESSLPDSIINSAFSKIPAEKIKKSGIYSIFDIEPINEAIGMIKDTFQTVRLTIKFAQKII